MAKKREKQKYNRVMAIPFIKSKIVEWRKSGYSEEGIAYKLDISYETLRNWKRDIPEFAELLRKGKILLEDELEKTIYKKALGLIKVTKTEKTIKRIKGGAVQVETIKQTVEEIPPSDTLLFRAQVNLGKWKDKSSEIVGNEANKAAIFVDDLSQLSDEELLLLEKDGVFDDDEI